MRTFHRLRLLCFASSAGKPQPCGFHITVLSTLLLFALSKPVPARHKKTAIKTHTTQTATCKCPHISCPGSTNGGLILSPLGNKIQT